MRHACNLPPGPGARTVGGRGSPVIPAEAGIQLVPPVGFPIGGEGWIPASAGMTDGARTLDYGIGTIRRPVTRETLPVR